MTAMSVIPYFDRLAAHARETVATDAGGAAVPLDDAMQRLVGLFGALPEAGGKAMIIGNGGSAAIASHFATDFTKNGGVPTMVFTDGALLTCLGNDLGYENVYAKPVEMFARAGDLLLAISSSGASANILAAARTALDRGMRVVSMSGFRPDNPLRSVGELNFYIDSDSYGVVECSHFMLCHLAVDLLTGDWPERDRQGSGPA